MITFHPNSLALHVGINVQGVVPLLMWCCNNIATDQVEMEGKNVSENAINEESSDGQNQHQPTDTEEKQSGSTVQELEVHYSYYTDVYV